jgi:hypothetical protein
MISLCGINIGSEIVKIEGMKEKNISSTKILSNIIIGKWDALGVIEIPG